MSHRTSRAAVAAGALALTTLLAACGGGTTRSSTEDAGGGSTADGGSAPAASADPAAEIPADLDIAFLPKQLNNPYSDIEVGGGEEAVEELSGNYSLVGPNDASASSQVSYINTLIQQQQDVIEIAANDPDAVCPSLQQAMDAGIAVVTFDSDASTECRDVFINQATTEGIGRTLAEQALRAVGDDGGQVAILSATANATNQNAWIDVMQTELEKPEYSGVELVDTVYGDDDDQKSFTETQGLLQTYPDLEAIVSPTTVGIAAAARYIQSSDYQGEVAVTGLGTPNQMRAYIEDGTVQEFALWDPADIGYLAGYAGAALVAGQITGAEGETFEAGRLGERTIEADGEIVLGPPTTFDSSNIDDFDF